MIKNQRILELLQAYKYDEAEKALKENIREELQKSSGTKSSDAAIIKRLVKAAEKQYNQWTAGRFSKYHPFTVSGVNYCGFTDGHYIIAGPDSCGYEAATDSDIIKMETFFTAGQNKIFTVDMQELRMFCKDKANKNHNNYMYAVKAPEGFAIAFNAKYMLDCLDFAGVDHFLYSAENVTGCIKSPLLIENEKEGKLCLCLPVNCTCSSAADCKALEYMEKWRKNEL